MKHNHRFGLVHESGKYDVVNSFASETSIFKKKLQPCTGPNVYDMQDLYIITLEAAIKN